MEMLLLATGSKRHARQITFEQASAEPGNEKNICLTLKDRSLSRENNSRRDPSLTTRGALLAENIAPIVLAASVGSHADNVQNCICILQMYRLAGIKKMNSVEQR